MSIAPRARGTSLLEVLLVLSLAAIVGTSLLGAYLATRDDARGRGAARSVAMRVAAVRLDALRRGAATGLIIEPLGGDFTIQSVVDGNGNGVRRDDIAAAVDPIVGPPFRLTDDFPGVRFAVGESLPPIDGDGPDLAAGADPIQIGSSSIVAFGPSGSGSSGTLYLAGAGRRQYAVRVFGPTGRIRIFEFLPATRQWVSP
jgi:type II secretory pathway pseudopilin PulG